MCYLSFLTSRMSIPLCLLISSIIPLHKAKKCCAILTLSMYLLVHTSLCLCLRKLKTPNFEVSLPFPSSSSGFLLLNLHLTVSRTSSTSRTQNQKMKGLWLSFSFYSFFIPFSHFPHISSTVCTHCFPPLSCNHCHTVHKDTLCWWVSFLKSHSINCMVPLLFSSYQVMGIIWNLPCLAFVSKNLESKL